jgi:hypothetical protein
MGTSEGNEFAGLIQNPKKIIGTPNLSIKTKNCVSYLKSGKGPKICPDGICSPDPKS